FHLIFQSIINTLHSYSSKISFFFINHPPSTKSYPLSLHDALPIFISADSGVVLTRMPEQVACPASGGIDAFTRQIAGNLMHRCQDRKSTRLNSSHVSISYAVFCLKKKKRKI